MKRFLRRCGAVALVPVWLVLAYVIWQFGSDLLHSPLTLGTLLGGIGLAVFGYFALAILWAYIAALWTVDPDTPIKLA